MKISRFPEDNPGCQSIEEASGGSFPANRLSAVRHIIGEEDAPSALLFLFDEANISTNQSFRVLTESESDLNNVGFDNRVAGVAVRGEGRWELFRNANFGETADRPSIELGPEPGNYPDISQVPGYPENTFPADLMSSAALIPPEPEPEPEPEEEPEPELECTEGTLLNPSSGKCECEPGLREVGQAPDGSKICRIDTASPPLQGIVPDEKIRPIRPPSESNLDQLPRVPVNPSVTVLPEGEIEQKEYETLDLGNTYGNLFWVPGSEGLNCPESQYITGIAIEAKTYVEELGIFCSSINEDTTLLSTTSDLVLRDGITNDNLESIFCPSNFILSGIKAKGGKYVDRIMSIRCSRFQGTSNQFVDVGIGGPGGTIERAYCDEQPGDYAFEIVATVGFWVDAISLKCKSQN